MIVEEKIHIGSSSQRKEQEKPPEQYAVIALDDKTTPHDFVIKTLCSCFNLDENQALVTIRHAEKNGRAVVRIYPKDIAETKSEYANSFARAVTNPLTNAPMELAFVCEPT